jgi:hypothetical protein
MLVLRHVTQRREIASALGVVLKEENVDVELVEQTLGDDVVAAFGVELPGAIATTQMHADGGRRHALQHFVGHLDVAIDQVGPVIAARREAGLHLRIAELGEGGFVHLHIGATGLRQRCKLLAKCVDDVGPESLRFLVRAGEHGLIAASKVKSARAGDGNLRHLLRQRLQEFEIFDVNWLRPTDATVDARDGLGRSSRRHGDAAAIVAGHVIGSYIAQLREEIAVVGMAAKLAIRHDAKSDAFLHRNGVADRRVLRRSQFGVLHRARRVTSPQIEQRRRAQQTADMFGAKRRRFHVSSLVSCLFGLSTGASR